MNNLVERLRARAYKTHGGTSLTSKLLTEAADRIAERSWQPIETAPRDGTRVLLCWRPFPGMSEHVELGKWNSAGWCNTYGKPFHGGEADYFMPLPAAPEPTP